MITWHDHVFTYNFLINVWVPEVVNTADTPNSPELLPYQIKGNAYQNNRELKHARFLRRGRQPEENISRVRRALSPRCLYYSSLMEKTYLAM